MQYRKIGSSDLEVSSICLGTWVFGGQCWGEVEDAQSVSVVEEAASRGINFIDTAPIYGGGRSEEVIGKALKNISGDMIIATKCGLEQKGSSIVANLSPAFIKGEVENSLRRLGREAIDLYQCHWPDEETPLEETFGEINKLIQEGKVRYIGVSNFNRQLMEEALCVAPIVSNQMQYSLFNRDIEESLVPLCREKGVSILSYGSLGGGILTGKYKKPPQVKKGDVKQFFYQYYKEPFWSQVKEFVPVLEEIASKHEAPTSDVAINWVLSSKEVASCIVGCRTPDQLAQNAQAANWSLTEEELKMIQSEYDRIFSS